MPIVYMCAGLSLLGILAAFALPGWTDLLLLAAPGLIASLLVILRGIKAQRGKITEKLVVMDGSNVMYWKGGVPDLETVRDVLRLLHQNGYRAGVMFDANAGYLLVDKYLRDSDFATMLDLPLEHVMVVPRGTPADPYLLNAARDMGAQIVTNDRFRDWAADFPEVETPGHLISGGYKAKGPWLTIGSSEPVASVGRRRAKA